LTALKVLQKEWRQGCWNCRVPEGMKKHVGLASKKCVPCEAGKVQALSDAEVNSYRNQTPGWQIITNAEGHRCLRQQWKVKNFKAGLECFERIGQIAEAEGHHPDLHLEGYNTVAADLSTHSVGEYHHLYACPRYKLLRPQSMYSLQLSSSYKKPCRLAHIHIMAMLRASGYAS